MNYIERQQPTPEELPQLYNRLKRGVKSVRYMQLDCIEYNPNYIGLFAHVIYGGASMCFLFSYNRLRNYNTNEIAATLKAMADRQLSKRGIKANHTISLYKQRINKRKVAR